MPQAGEQIGPYTLVRQLGRGAFGLVWLAERRGAFATTQVAIKLILDDEPDLDAITQESQLWAQLGGHPNVLPIIEADKYNDHIVIVSEYAPDGTLNDWLKKHNGVAPSIEAAIAMTIGILNGLEHLHSKKIIHRDLKPANILLQGETPRLADFGLARVLKSSLKSGGVAGTPAYMAPEVFDGERSASSDLWSVGVILYQMLAGRLPFPQSDLMALLGAIIKNDAEILPDYVPFALAQVVAQALQKNPTKRYQAVSDMRGALQAISTNGEITPIKLQVGDRPTLVVNTAKQTNPEQTAATLPELPSKNKSYPSEQTINKTVEQPPARLTQESISKDFPIISKELPATEKISLTNLKPQSDNLSQLSNNRFRTKRKLIYVASFLAVWAFLSQLPGSFGKFFPFPFFSKKNNEKTISANQNVNNVSNLPIAPKVEVIDNNVIKDSNKLSMEIGKRLALLEKELLALPKGKERGELQQAFEDIRDGFEDISLEDIKPETLKPLYEGYIVGLDSLIAVLEANKSEVKSKVKTPPNINEAVKIAKPSLPPSPNIPIPDQKEVIGTEFGSALEKKNEDIILNNVQIQERLKELKRMTREVRQMRKDAQRQLKEDRPQTDPIEPIEPVEPPLRRKFMEKGLREQEKRRY